MKSRYYLHQLHPEQADLLKVGGDDHGVGVYGQVLVASTALDDGLVQVLADDLRDPDTDQLVVLGLEVVPDLRAVTGNEGQGLGVTLQIQQSHRPLSHIASEGVEGEDD